MDKFIGKRLDGRYEIREIIGIGGMAVVYKAYDNVEDRIVAIKILKEEFVSNEEFIRRFKNESKAIAVLSHPNIVKVYDVSFGDLIQYIVMEYIDGITLKEYIERQGSLRWKDAVHFTSQILKGLQHAHDKGIVHRDVKPQNIMLLPDGTIKVTDFGIARFARSEQRTITDKAIGSVHYISPEQARGEKTDEKADIYSVGVMLYEMITGQLPFQAESAVSVAIMQLQRDPQLPTEINSSIPLGLEQITMHAMQKTPERRYQSAAEMLCDVDTFKKDPSATFEYSYFVDDSPTKFVGAVRSSTPASEAQIDDIPEENDEKEKSATIPILAGIAAALVVVIAVVGVFVFKSFSQKTKEIKCPDFVGKSLEELKDTEDYNNFDISIEWGHNNEHESGVVYNQSKDEGTPLKKGAKLTLYVSMGESTIKVPDVYGQSEQYAVAELKSKGFKTVVTEISDEDVDAGLVIKTEPARTTVVAEGTEITVFVSTGETVKLVEVPDLIGLTKERAESDLKKAGLVAKFEDRDIASSEEYYEKGYVIAQNPEVSKVDKGSTVTVYVSTGMLTYDVKVNLPDDYKFDTGRVSLWVDGAIWKNGTRVIESDKIEINSLGSYTFKGVKSTPDSFKAVVKLTNDGNTYHEISEIIIYPENNGSTSWITNYMDYPKKSDEPTETDKPSEEDNNN